MGRMLITSAIGPLGAAGVWVTLPGTTELLALTVGSLLKRSAPRGDPGACGKLCVVIPAVDEADPNDEALAGCIASLRAADTPPNGVQILVVAPEGAGAAAQEAERAGAEVLKVPRSAATPTLVEGDESGWPTPGGRAYAVRAGLTRAFAEDAVEAALIVDADSLVEDTLLVTAAAAFAGGADAVQCTYEIQPAEGGTPPLGPLSRALRRPLCRENLGLSAGLLGNGLGIHRRVWESLPYPSDAPGGDWAYHLALICEGFRVRYLKETTLRVDSADKAAERWAHTSGERERYRLIRERGPDLMQGVLKGRLELLEPLAELLSLPLGTQTAVLGGLLLLPNPPVQLYALGSLAITGAHVLTQLLAAQEGGMRGWRDAPQFVVDQLKQLKGRLRPGGRPVEGSVEDRPPPAATSVSEP